MIAIPSRAVLCAVFLALGLTPAAQAQQGQRCPDNPKSSTTFFDGKASSDDDKNRLIALAGSVRDQSPVCILALTDPADEKGYSKKLALRRALWVRDILLKNGVPAGTIAVELRPGAADQDKDALRQVQVIRGR